MTTTYRFEAIDTDGNTIYTAPMDIGTLDGVLVFQFDRDLVVSDAELARLDARIAKAFPDRRRLILTGGIRFVRFSPVNE